MTTFSTVLTEREYDVIDRVREDLLSGRSFAFVAQSERSARGWSSKIIANREHWARAVGGTTRIGA